VEAATRTNVSSCGCRGRSSGNPVASLAVTRVLLLPSLQNSGDTSIRVSSLPKSSHQVGVRFGFRFELPASHRLSERTNAGLGVSPDGRQTTPSTARWSAPLPLVAVG
jgi:hypothetical protein